MPTLDSLFSAGGFLKWDGAGNTDADYSSNTAAELAADAAFTGAFVGQYATVDRPAAADHNGKILWDVTLGAFFESNGSAWSEVALGGGGTVTVTDVTGTSDTIGSGDLGKILRYTDAGLVTVTLPDGLAVGSIVHLLFWGAAGGAIQDNGTSTVQPEGSVAQYDEVSCVVVATNTWSVQGNVT